MKMGVDINTYRAAIGSHSDPPMKMPKISGKFCEYRKFKLREGFKKKICEIWAFG